MRRIALITLLVIVPSAIVLLGAGGSGGTYRVTAIFDNASFVVAGEDVKVAGVRVGKIESLKVTRNNKAAVTLTITDPGYQDFRRDAQCKIRPQSLIGEEFIECSPTQPRAANEPLPPPLRQLENGNRLLPVSQTSASVDLDLIGDTLRLPERERLSIILNELGVGLAGRGSDLNAVLRRSAPALQELNKVLKILATQNKTLSKLAVDSDRIMAPLARERRHVSGFIDNSAKVARATADRRRALEQTLQKFPRFLDELRPTMARLGAFAQESTPVVSDLGDTAADLDELLKQTGPFSDAATPALVELGRTAGPGIPAIKGSIPIVKDLRGFAKQLRPVGATLANVLTSFQKNNGLERFLDYVYYQGLAVNGFDSIGHYLRAGLLVNTCSTYSTEALQGCLANFVASSKPSASSARAAGASGDKTLQATSKVLNGAKPEDVLTAAELKQVKKQIAARRKALERQATKHAAEAAQQQQQAQQPAPAPASPTTTDALLDYLMGSDG
jgi:phospholipid/cholesterol/gamma-HCH transport system substrate-binding protein